MATPLWLQRLHLNLTKRQTARSRRQATPGARPRVEVLEDRVLPSTYVVTNTGDNGGVNPTPGGGTGTLRQAIVDADAAGTGSTANPDLIQFSIPTTDPGYQSGTGSFTIQPLSVLPTITDTIFLDGYTQPGASPNTLAIGDNAVLKIVLNGSQAGSVDGLVIGGGNSTVRGLVIDNFAFGYGIEVAGNGNDVVVGNFLGTDVTGTTALGNLYAIDTESVNNTVGGTSPAARNIISGNNYAGVYEGGNGNVLLGNYIGTTANGAAALGNLTYGVQIGGVDNIIGGTSVGAVNVISGNASAGVEAGGSGAVVLGNFIGTDATGTFAIGDTEYGVLGGSDNTFGGTTPGMGNLIAGNVYGISIENGAGNVIQGNAFGQNINGASLPPLGSEEVAGISLWGGDNLIGGTGPVLGMSLVTPVLAFPFLASDRSLPLATRFRATRFATTVMAFILFLAT